MVKSKEKLYWKYKEGAREKMTKKFVPSVWQDLLSKRRMKI